MRLFTLASVVAWAIVVLVAGLVRGRPYVFVVGVMLGIYTLIATGLAEHTGALLPAFAYLHASVFVNFAMLARPRMRPLAYRVLVSWPGSFFLGGTMLSFPWAIAFALGLHPGGFWVPYALAFVGFVDTFLPRRGSVEITVGEPGPRDLARAPRTKGHDARPLRIVQITDPHLGPFMSAARLRRICERAVASRPDLVLLTGDFLTMESQRDLGLLGSSLAPLRALEGRAFACFGNHDHEAPAHVRAGLAHAGVRLLVDAMARVETEAGPVEILGFDFRRQGREAHLREVADRHPRDGKTFRMGLLHDPAAFAHLPEGAADLVLSGHTHGGQLGLLWAGLPQTIVSALTRIPDHGLWRRGADKLYVHRGTGHYGFPLRIGVPPEESVLVVHRADPVPDPA